MNMTFLPIRTLRWWRRGVVALLLLGALTVSWAQNSYQWRDVVQTVDIQADGTVVVNDERTLVATSGDFNEAFICLDLTANQSLELLDGGALGPGPSAQAYTQPCEDGSGGTELVVEMDNEVRVTERRVFYRYALSGALDYYSDVVQWYWIILEEDHPPVRGYELTVTVPGSMAEPYNAYVHRFSNLEEPLVTLTSGRDELWVVFEQIPDGDGVEIRYLMDPMLFDRRGSEAGLEQLLRDEARVGRENGRERLWSVLRPILYVALTILTLGLALGPSIYFFVNIWREGRDPVRPQMHHRFEPPSDLPPFAVAMLDEKTYKNPSIGATRRAFSATVMDLARRGYGKFRSEGGELFGGQAAFEMSLDLGKDQSALHPPEQRALKYLHDAAARTGRPEYLDAAELRAHSWYNWSRFSKAWGKGARRWLEEALGSELVTTQSHQAMGRNKLKALLMIPIAMGISTIAIALSELGGGGWILVALPLVLMPPLSIGTAIAVVALSRKALAWSEDAAAEVYGWQSFKRTLQDYTIMQSAPDDFFVLWDRYFCYAAALGVSERYLANVRREMPAHGFDERTRVRQASWIDSSSDSANLDLGALLSFPKGITKGLVSKPRKSRSSSSSSSSGSSGSASSGGSSSGGGGGGGGGSSGGR